MAGLRVLWVGRTTERFVAEGIEHYRRRIAPLQALELVEVRAAGHSGRDPAEAARREGELLLRRIAPDEVVALLDERGREHTTRALAGWLQARLEEPGGRVCFVIGGAHGVDAAVRRRADHVLALSRLTMPHQLVRVVLLEQLYRTLSLLAGHAYHHG